MVAFDALAAAGRDDVVFAAQLLVALALAVVVVRPLWAFYRRPYASNLRNLKGPPIRHPFWGSWPPGAEVNGAFEKHILETINEYGPVARVILMGRRPSIILGDHKACNKFLLQTPYNRLPIINKIIRRHAGRGLLTEEGATHRRQRKIAHPAFTMPAVHNMTPIFHNKAADLITRLRRKFDDDATPVTKEYGARTNIAKDFFATALDIIGESGFDYQFNATLSTGETTALEQAFHDCLHLLTTGSIFSALRALFDEPVVVLGRLFRVKEQLHLDRSKKLVNDISAELVQRAKAHGTAGKDLLSLMVHANTAEDLKEHQRMSDQELSQTVITFLFAGHETTATAMSWAMLPLVDPACGQEIQARMRKELLADDAWRDSPSALDALPYLDAFTRETMRYYCPVRALPRQAPYDDVLPLARPTQLRDGSWVKEIHIKKGQTVNMPISWMNRHESLWGPDGQVFKPERWLPAGHEYKGADAELDVDPSVQELRGVWSNLATFGAGPMQCIGVRMAIMEFKALLANLVTSFEFLPPNLPNEPPVEIEALMEIVAHPIVKGDGEGTLNMPVRYKPLAS